MSSEKAVTRITKENLDEYLKALAKEYRKLNGTKTTAELILIGGASVLINYGFREVTNDIDAIIDASSAMKDAINRVGDNLRLERGWLNTDFTRTASFSTKLYGISQYYRTFSNIVQVRTVSAEYLIAMKLMSGRQYKFDLSDVAGILLEHEKRGTPITQADVQNAIITLYGNDAKISDTAQRFIDAAFADGEYEKIYKNIREREKESKEMLLDFQEKYPGTLTEANTDDILEKLNKKKVEPPKPSILARLEAAKAEALELNAKNQPKYKKKDEPER